jgi:hypothetical protein
LICTVCRREARGFGFEPKLGRVSGRPAVTCSMRCLDTAFRGKGMIDPTPNEQAAMEAGGQLGGEYLDSIGKTDLAALSASEWATFVEAVVTGYCGHLREIAARDQAKLDAMRGEAMPA